MYFMQYFCILFANSTDCWFIFFHSELPPLPPIPTPDPDKPTPTTTPTTTTTTTHAPGTGFCNGKPDGLYPHEEDKSLFYMCAHGVTHVRSCGSGSVFDDKCKCCVWPWNWDDPENNTFSSYWMKFILCCSIIVFLIYSIKIAFASCQRLTRPLNVWFVFIKIVHNYICNLTHWQGRQCIPQTDRETGLIDRMVTLQTGLL